MNNVRPRSCQTSWSRVILLLAAGCLTSLPGLSGAEVPLASPPPPPWQSEVNAARVMQASLLLIPARDVADYQARRTRLAAIYRDLAKKYPEISPVQQAVGDGLAELESPTAGIPYWQTAGKVDPKNAEAAETLGTVYLQLDQVREAAAQFQRAVEARPEVASYHFELANVQYLFRHQLVEPPAFPDDQAVLRSALAHFRRAAELSPGDLRIATAYAETFYVFAKPDWVQALAAWQAVLGMSGENPDFANSHLARISVRLGDRALAEGYLASIRGRSFAEMKAKLSQQIARMGTSATTPSSAR